MRGWLMVLGLVALVGVFMVAVALVGNELRQDYRVLSRGDVERAQLDFDGQHALWLEQNGSRPAQVWAYDVPAKQRVLLGEGADPARPVAVADGHAAWVVGNHTVFHDFGDGTTWDGPASLRLAGRTLSGDRALLVDDAGRAWLHDLRSGRSRPADGAGEAVHITGGARLRGDVLAWGDGSDVLARDLANGTTLLQVRTNATVQDVDFDGRSVVWNSDPRPAAPRRVLDAALGEGVAHEVPAPPGHAWAPAVDGSRVVFVQADGLVRLVDLGSGAAKVLPARDQENLRPRIAGSAAVWLSGTIQGHNVLLVPLGS